ncbi:hypothetical protein ACNS7O_03750 [Haloferacaceae archaeon DSL9]
MYLSHPVRRVRDDPIAGESIALVVELEDLSAGALATRIDELDGSVDRELPFDSWRVELPQPAVAALCETDGLARIETANTISLSGDE